MAEPKPILLDLPEELPTQRCIIRRYRPGDGVLLHEATSASLEHLKPWMPWAHLDQSVEDMEEKARQFHVNWLFPRTDLTLGIFNLAQDRILGGTGLHRIDWRLRSFEIGYWIRPDEQGKGLVTEVVRELCRFAFETLEANRVFIRCDESNTRSAAVPRRLGFVEEGMFLNGSSDGYGTVVNTLSFGMNPEIWSARKV